MKLEHCITKGALALALFAPACAADSLDTASDELSAPPGEDLLAIDDAYAAKKSDPLVVGVSDGVIANDVTGGAKVDAVLDSLPAHGSLGFGADGSFVYVPHERRFACGDHFEYHLEGAIGVSNVARVDLDFDDPLCRRYTWNAYEDKPYIYRGCPDPEPWIADPDPIPWRDVPTFVAAHGDQMIEIELASDVALRVEVTSAPRTGDVIPSEHGFTFVPGASGPSRERIAIAIGDGACAYAAEAELVIE